MTTPETLTDTERHALWLDGAIWRQGSLYGAHPGPPLLAERAELVGHRLPNWAIAAGHTAGWVWTGLGRPEPWSLICPTKPAISPITRSAWKPRARQAAELELVSLRGLQLLSPRTTVADLMVCPGDDDVAAAQIYELSTLEDLTDIISQLKPLAPRVRERARRRRALVTTWWRDYPVVTR